MRQAYKSSCLSSDFEYIKKRPFGNGYIVRWGASAYTEGSGETAVEKVLYNETIMEERPTYPSVVSLLIRQEYSMDDELALNRQREEKPEEWQRYYEFCEECKVEAKKVMDIEGNLE